MAHADITCPISPTRNSAPTWRRASISDIATRAALLGLLCVITIAVGAVVWLHTLPGWGGVDPVAAMLSGYGLGPRGWVFNGAMDAVGVASVGLLVVLRTHGVVRGWVASTLLALWCVCLVGVGSFTKDPTVAAATVHGAIHLAVTATACVSLPLAALVVGHRHRRDPRSRSHAIAVRWFAVSSLPCCLPFLVSFVATRLTHDASFWSTLPTGLVERLMAGMDVVILIVFVHWAWQTIAQPAADLPPSHDRLREAVRLQVTSHRVV